MIKLKQVVVITEAYAACLAATEKLRARHQVAVTNVSQHKKQLAELESQIKFTANVDLTEHKQMLRDLRFENQDLLLRQRLLAAGEIELSCLSDILRVTRQAYFATKELVVSTTSNV
jgi:hypothetical protein